MGAELPVVDLKIRHRATGLTPPAVATQDLPAQTFVRQGIQPQVSGFWTNHFQDAFSRRFSRTLLVFAGQESEESRHRVQQRL